MRKRILFLVGGTQVYGAEITMLNLMRGLKMRGHVVHCIVSGWNDGDFISRLEQHHIPYSILYLGFIYIRKMLWTLDTLWHYPSAFIRFCKIKRRFKPDFIYHQSLRTIITLYPLLPRKRTVLHVHDILLPSFTNKIQVMIVRNKVARFITVSNSVRKRLLELGIVDSRIEIVSNGISDFTQFNGSTEGKAKEKKERNIIGIVGQITHGKGHLLLVESLNLLKNSRYDFACFIVGRGDASYIKQVKELIGHHGLEQKVKWVDYLKDQNSIYDMLDILAVPSNNEAFGLVALEGALKGLPVVASRVGGLQDIVQDGVTGFLFTPGDGQELAEKLSLLLDNEQLRIDMGKPAREHALRKFTHEAMCNKIDKLLGSML